MTGRGLSFLSPSSFLTFRALFLCIHISILFLVKHSFQFSRFRLGEFLSICQVGSVRSTHPVGNGKGAFFSGHQQISLFRFFRLHVSLYLLYPTIIQFLSVAICRSSSVSSSAPGFPVMSIWRVVPPEKSGSSSNSSTSPFRSNRQYLILI